MTPFFSRFFLFSHKKPSHRWNLHQLKQNKCEIQMNEYLVWNTIFYSQLIRCLMTTTKLEDYCNWTPICLPELFFADFSQICFCTICWASASWWWWWRWCCTYMIFIPFGSVTHQNSQYTHCLFSLLNDEETETPICLTWNSDSST